MQRLRPQRCLELQEMRLMHRAITALSMRLCGKQAARRAGGTPRMRALVVQRGLQENSKAPNGFLVPGASYTY